MADHVLLPSQKNDVFQRIQDAGFDPADFTWDDRPSKWGRKAVPVLVHGPTGFWFTFEWSGAHHMALHSPGRDSAESPAFETVVWANQIDALRSWLGYLKREYHAPNLWGELDRQRELAAATESVEAEDNRPFTAEEQAQIARQLDEIKELLVRNEQLDAEHRRRLEAGIEHLKDGATRMGRREWLTLFYGTVFPWALSGLVSPDGVRQAIMLVAHGLSHLFGAPLPELGP